MTATFDLKESYPTSASVAAPGHKRDGHFFLFSSQSAFAFSSDFVGWCSVRSFVSLTASTMTSLSITAFKPLSVAWIRWPALSNALKRVSTKRTIRSLFDGPMLALRILRPEIPRGPVWPTAEPDLELGQTGADGAWTCSRALWAASTTSWGGFYGREDRH